MVYYHPYIILGRMSSPISLNQPGYFLVVKLSMEPMELRCLSKNLDPSFPGAQVRSMGPGIFTYLLGLIGVVKCR